MQLQIRSLLSSMLRNQRISICWMKLPTQIALVWITISQTLQTEEEKITTHLCGANIENLAQLT